MSNLVIIFILCFTPENSLRFATFLLWSEPKSHGLGFKFRFNNDKVRFEFEFLDEVRYIAQDSKESTSIDIKNAIMDFEQQNDTGSSLFNSCDCVSMPLPFNCQPPTPYPKKQRKSCYKSI